MAEATASVSKNLALADLDEVLRALLKDELDAVQVKGVEITFEAPTRERSSAWHLPAVNLFLYDLREAGEPRDRGWHHRANGDGATLERAPMRLACTFAITAWTTDVVDEHKLLSQVLAVLLAYPVLPASMLPEDSSLLVGIPPVGLSTRVGQAKEEGRADFWSAIGSPYKVSLEYVVTIYCVAGQALARGSHRVRGSAVSETPIGTRHEQSGRVLDAGGAGVDDVWVALPAVGSWTRTDAAGRFEFAQLPAGAHDVILRSPGGATVTTTLTVPAPPAVLRLV